MARAIALLPAEIRPFFEQVRDHRSSSTRSIPTSGARSGGSRRRRGTSSTWTPTARIRSRISRTTTTRRSSGTAPSSSTKNGTLPWRTEEIYQKLVEAFTQKAAVRAREHQVVLVGARPLHRGRARAVPRDAQPRRPADRTVGHPLALRERAVRAVSPTAAALADGRRPPSAIRAISCSTRSSPASRSSSRSSTPTRRPSTDARSTTTSISTRFFEKVKPILEKRVVRFHRRRGRDHHRGVGRGGPAGAAARRCRNRRARSGASVRPAHGILLAPLSLAANVVAGGFSMLWTIVVVLLILWVLGFAMHVAGGLIHALLVIAAGRRRSSGC